MKKKIVLLLLACGVAPNLWAAPSIQEFPMECVRLDDGVLKTASDVNRKVLDDVSNDTVLYGFRKNAGLPTPGKRLDGWAGPGHRFGGHYEAHLLSALALSYAQTGDASLLARVNVIVDGLADVQKALVPGNPGEPEGYLSAFPETRFDVLEAGKPSSVPWYMIHKIMASLLDAYNHCGNEKALAIAKKMAAWVSWRSYRLSDKDWQACLAREEFGGMAEVLENLYVVTKNENDRKLAHRFEQPSLLDPLSRNLDNLAGNHANTYLAKIMGTARIAEVEGDAYHLDVTRNFWNFVLATRTYSTGGNSLSERFGPANHLSREVDGTTQETCNTYNMLKITRQLFKLSGSVSYADYYERALFNGILGSMNPTGEKTYPQYMKTNAKKVFHSNTKGCFCCNGTGLESFSKFGDSIYFHDGSGIFVNLFISSKLNWKEKGMSLVQRTGFPEEQATTITIHAEKPVSMPVRIRVPCWIKEGYAVKVNNEVQNLKAIASSYVTIDRLWRDGDVISVAMPFALDKIAMSDNSNLVSFTYGPIVLVGVNSGDVRLCGDLNTLSSWIVPVPGSNLTFAARDAKGGTVTLKPYYKVVDESYTTYWDTKVAEDKGSESAQKLSLKEFRQHYPLKPVRDYTFLATERSAIQPWKEVWRYDKPVMQATGIIDGWFDPGTQVPWLKEAMKKSAYEFGLVDGYLPAVHYTYRNPAGGATCDMTVFAVDSATPGTIIIHVALVTKDGGTVESQYLKVDGGLLPPAPKTAPEPALPVPAASSKEEFEAALQGMRSHWETFFAKGAKIPIPDPDVMLACKASIIRALITLTDKRVHYGLLSYGPVRKAGIEYGDGFPPTFIALVDCLLDWGQADLARECFTAYFDVFVHDDGRVKYYLNKNQEGCSVAEYGQLLWLARKCMDAGGSQEWFGHIRPKLECIRASAWAAAAKHPSGMIPGCGEADLRSQVGLYFHNNGWMVRGLRDIAALLGHPEDLPRCDAFQKTIQAAIAKAENRSVSPMFIPPMAEKTAFNIMTPFKTMTEPSPKDFISYTNYRYWPELLSSGILTREQAEAVIAYRNSHGGEIAGLGRFQKQADNWPIAEYAMGLMALGHRDEVQRILYSHLAGHMTSETWTAYEQVKIEGAPYRIKVADYCVPSQLVAPRLAAWLWGKSKQQEKGK